MSKKQEKCESILSRVAHRMRDLAVERDFKGIYDLSKEIDDLAEQFTEKCLKPDRERQKQVAEREVTDWKEFGWPD